MCAEAGKRSHDTLVFQVLLFAATGEFPWKSCSGFEAASKLNAFAFFFKVRAGSQQLYCSIFDLSFFKY